MKRFTITAIILIFVLCAITDGLPASAAADLRTRAVWVTSVYNLDYPSKPGLSADALKAQADMIIENASAWGLNTIFLQVRPSSDALYSSDIFPWSAYLSGEQGVAPDGGFDPLAYFIERAHGLEIEVHAWINPYRITRASQQTREQAFALLSENHPARDMPQAVVFHTDGCLYFDPGSPEARALILDGIMEIIDNYDVDGIHMDDYFYPGSSFDDAQTFAHYGDGFNSIGDFRRASVTQLIVTVSSRLNALPRHIAFGISPFGVWANESQHPEGSATAGDSSYFSHFADTRAWIQSEIIDYIMPQLYWPIGSTEADFQTLLDWWDDVVRGTSVELHIGIAAYRLLEATAGSSWEGVGEIERQLEAMGSSCTSGAGFYRYRSIADNPALADLLREYFALPSERFYMPYHLPVSAPTNYAVESELVRASRPFELSVSAPPGSTVGVFLCGKYTGMCESADGAFAAYAQLDGGELFTEHFPVLVSETNGFVRVEIIPQKITVVKAEQPVSITRISSTDIGEEHRVIFETGTPAAAKLERRGAAVLIEITPCRMGVLFEDEYFERIDFLQNNETGVYAFILPVSANGSDCALEWNESSVTLIISRLED